MKTIIAVALGFLMWRLMRWLSKEPMLFILVLAASALVGVQYV